MYPCSMFRAKIRKNIIFFHPKFIIFTAVRNRSILHKSVTVMYITGWSGSLFNILIIIYVLLRLCSWRITLVNEPRHDKIGIRGFSTRSDTNRPVRPRKMALMA